MRLSYLFDFFLIVARLFTHVYQNNIQKAGTILKTRDFKILL